MLWKTHLAFGLLVALVLEKYLPVQNSLIYFSLVLFGALLPDIDHPKSFIGKRFKILSKIISFFAGHRGILHSALFAVVLCGVLYKFVGPFYGISLFVGYLSHIVSDAFSQEGINFLYPFANLHLRGFIKVGSSGETVLFLFLIVLIILQFL